ncbi:carboxymuconolactone decarboxylase family protein [Amycolatopsis acidiphila]|uniref:Carboxymuconolactone decarboxylase family protein n=1 Tax=Amycolatopsis acidiphila TaxID=715473 RepID=A0A558A8F1_9PSEU|nr:carboxymuconolactone decarboxylase family protein [Amycolatopsis acidiphila]
MPWFRPEELDEEQRRCYDELLGGPRDRSVLTDAEGRLEGAFNARLLDPPVGTAIQQLGAALRYGSRIGDRQRELVILTVAVAERCDYEWHGHVPGARRAGLSEQQLTALRAGAPVPGLSDDDRIACEVAAELLRDNDLCDISYARAAAALGLATLFDIVSLVGHYRHTALALRVWRVPLRAGDAAVFGGSHPAVEERA